MGSDATHRKRRRCFARRCDGAGDSVRFTSLCARDLMPMLWGAWIWYATKRMPGATDCPAHANRRPSGISINMAYSNTGTIGPEDADVLISLKEWHGPTADYIKSLRARLISSTISDCPTAAGVSRIDLRFPAGGYRLADSQFRTAGADRRAYHRQSAGGELRLCQ
jgi:hypothetical protein